MKKTLSILLFALVMLLAVGCGKDKTEDTSPTFNIAKFKNEIQTAKSFNVSVSLQCIADVEELKIHSTNTVDSTLIVSLTEDYFDLNATEKNFYTYRFDTEYTEFSTDGNVKIIDKEIYGQFFDDNTEGIKYWINNETASSVSSMAENFIYKHETKEDIVDLLNNISNSLKDEKDLNGNYLLDKESLVDFLSSASYYLGYEDYGDYELFAEKYYFDVTNEEVVISYSVYWEFNGEKVEYIVDFRINNFSDKALIFEAPEKEMIYDGISINAILTSPEKDQINIDISFGNIDVVYNYMSENQEVYFYVNLSGSAVVKYGVPFEVTVYDAAGWHGQILGDATPYYEYFKQKPTLEITIYEDGTFTSNFPTISEILEWYSK